MLLKQAQCYDALSTVHRVYMYVHMYTRTMYVHVYECLAHNDIRTGTGNVVVFAYPHNETEIYIQCTVV